MSNEEGVQTTLTCASEDVLKEVRKIFVEKAAQTIFSYNPDLSNTDIRNELRSGNPNHDVNAKQKTNDDDDVGGGSTDVVTDDDIGQLIESDLGDPNEGDDVTGGNTDRVTDDGSGELIESDLGDRNTDHTTDVTTEDEEGNAGLYPIAETKKDSVDSVDSIGSIGSVTMDELKELDSIDGEGNQGSRETGSNCSIWLAPSPPTNNMDKQDREPQDGVLVQTGIVCGTGKDAPEMGKVAAEGQAKETGMQTKFGGYPPDQSDTLIIEELQTKVPVHSQDEVVKPEEIDSLDEPIGVGSGGFQPDDMPTLVKHTDDSEQATPEENSDDSLEASPQENADDISQVEPEEIADDLDGKENTEDSTGDVAALEELSNPVEIEGSALDSGAQTVFSYDPMMSNSQIVDELANAYPKHSTENALESNSTPPVETPLVDSAPPTLRSGSDAFVKGSSAETVDDSFKSCQSSDPINVGDGEQSEFNGETGDEDFQSCQSSDPINVGDGETGGEDFQSCQSSDPINVGDGETGGEDFQSCQSSDPINLGDGEQNELINETDGEGEFSDKIMDTPAEQDNVSEEFNTEVEERVTVEDSQDQGLEGVEEASGVDGFITVNEQVEDFEDDAGDADKDTTEGDQMPDENVDLVGNDEMVDENKIDGVGNATMTKEAETVDNHDVESEDGTGVQTMLTCASLEEYPKVTRYVEQNMQTVFSYNPDLSNTKILNELKTKQPGHEDTDEEIDKNVPPDTTQLEVIPESQTVLDIDKGPTVDSVDNREVESTEDEATAEVLSSKTHDSETEDNDNYITTSDGEHTDDGEMTNTNEAETEHYPEIQVPLSKQNIVPLKSKSLSFIDAKKDDPQVRARAESYPGYKHQAVVTSLQLPGAVAEADENIDGHQETSSQTQVGFGTSSSPKGIDEKASNTYFSYGTAMSDSQIVDELRIGDPIHSHQTVSFLHEDKGRLTSEESLFNDDWEKNESSGEGELEVQDINATTSKASDWIPGRYLDDDADDADINDLQINNDVTLPLVLEDKEGDDNNQKTLTQTDISFGDTLKPVVDSQKNEESSLSVHISFSFQVGNSKNTMQMKLPYPDNRPSNAAMTEKLNYGNEKIHGTLPILVTVKCERRTNESGNVVIEPVVELSFQMPPSNELRSMVQDSTDDDTVPCRPDENDKQGMEHVSDDETPSNTTVDGLYTNPVQSSEDKREIQIQTDLVLGALLFSESISSVSEGGFETASEGPLMHDEELILPSVPLEEPSSKIVVPWGEGSLDDVVNENNDAVYDDLHLLVDPKEVCGEQYVQQLTPGSHENIPMTDKSLHAIVKIPTEDLLDVPDKVSSLTARQAYGHGKKVKVAGGKLYRWGFPQENNTSSATLLPSTYGSNGKQSSTTTILNNNGNLFNAISGEKSAGVLTCVATRIIFEFQTSNEDFLSTDGRAPAVKSKIAFQVMESKDKDNHSMHVATLDFRESIAPSKVMFMSNGEMMSRVLQPQGSPLELPIDGQPLVLKLSLPQPRHVDGSPSTVKTTWKVPFTITQNGNETPATTKALTLGGSPLQFTLPFGEHGGTMTIAANIEDNSSDLESPEVLTMTTTFDEVTSPVAKKPSGVVCPCTKKRTNEGKATVVLPKEQEYDNPVPVEDAGRKSKIITAMVINDGVPGEKQTKVLRPGGSPLYVNMPSSNGVPVRARVALNPQPDGAGKTIHDGPDLETKVSCKIVHDGVETETKSKMMKPGGSPLRLDLPIGNGGHVTANVQIPKTDDNVSGSPTDEGKTPIRRDKRGTTEEKRLSTTTTGDRCFDIISEALATYSREIDPLRKALEEITEKVKELNMPELAGIGEPPNMSYHALDEFINQPSPITYRHKITLQTGVSRISTTIHSGPSARKQIHSSSFPNPTNYSSPERPGNRCPLANPPSKHLQTYMQPPPGSYHQPYTNHPSNKCPYATDNLNGRSPTQNQVQSYGHTYPEHSDYKVGLRYSDGADGYDYSPQSVFNIRSRVYLASDRQYSREQDVPKNTMRRYTADTEYNDYRPQQWSPIAEMYIKLSRNSRSSGLYEDDEDSLLDEDDDYQGNGCRRGPSQHRYTPQRKPMSRGGDNLRCKAKHPRCDILYSDDAASKTGLELTSKDSYWCDPEDVRGSTKPGPMGSCRGPKVN